MIEKNNTIKAVIGIKKNAIIIGETHYFQKIFLMNLIKLLIQQIILDILDKLQGFIFNNKKVKRK